MSSDSVSTHPMPPFFSGAEYRAPAGVESSRKPTPPRPEIPQVADRRELVLSTSQPLQLRTRVAGLFLFLPLLAKLGFHKLVEQAGYPGSEMIPADAAILSLLTLKLLDKERLSHIDDFNFEEALGLFAGLNILPKKTFIGDYSYRTDRAHQQKLLAGWVQKLSPLLLSEARAFSLDFHPIPYRGEEAVLENHYIPCRGQAHPSVQSFFAGARKPGVLLCQCQYHACGTAGGSLAICRVLARLDGGNSALVVFRFQADNLF